MELLPYPDMPAETYSGIKEYVGNGDNIHRYRLYVMPDDIEKDSGIVSRPYAVTAGYYSGVKIVQRIVHHVEGEPRVRGFCAPIQPDFDTIVANGQPDDPAQYGLSSSYFPGETPPGMSELWWTQTYEWGCWCPYELESYIWVNLGGRYHQQVFEDPDYGLDDQGNRRWMAAWEDYRRQDYLAVYPKPVPSMLDPLLPLLALGTLATGGPSQILSPLAPLLALGAQTTANAQRFQEDDDDDDAWL